MRIAAAVKWYEIKLCVTLVCGYPIVWSIYSNNKEENSDRHQF
ncbi:hypothetical protein [Nostoc sp.]